MSMKSRLPGACRFFGKGGGAKPRGQRGVFLPLIAVALLPLLAMAGLALDMGHLYWNRTRLQNSISTAALMAARILDDKGNAYPALTYENLAYDEAKNTFQNNQVALGYEGGRGGNEELLSDSAGNNPYEALQVEYSDALPFTPGDGANARFVRVSLPSFRRPYWLSQVLNLIDPGFGTDFDSSAGVSAVAGPSPQLACPANIVPLLACVDPTDPSNRSKFLLAKSSPTSPFKLLEGGDIRHGITSTLCVGDTASTVNAGANQAASYTAIRGTATTGLDGRRRSDSYASGGIDYISFKRQIGYPHDSHPRVMTVPVVDCSGGVVTATTVTIRAFDCFYLQNTPPASPSAYNRIDVIGGTTYIARVPADAFGNSGCLNQGVGMDAGPSYGVGPHTIILY